MISNSSCNTGDAQANSGDPGTDILRVIFADDSQIYRQQQSELLRQFSSVKLVGVAESGIELLDIAKSVAWDAALLDIAMPELDGIETLRRLMEIRPNATILMLTAFERPQTLREALAAGAKGFLTKETSTEELVSALHRAYHGKTVFDQRPTEMLRDYYVRGDGSHTDEDFVARLEGLPERLYKIAQLLAQSYTNREISRATGLSEHTVGSYVRDTIRLLGARRGEIAVKMRELNLRD
ncbi:response regulator transcription factor [Trueperella pyogenes]|uniref:Response regulator transcription factor n=1 Tax=Trueperella pyogenes TaxID=1661 RepID=A0ABV3N9M5_9ACTO|nr:response regulator transcription factor [Trueperella pyogenes]UVJ53093.1 response regulator transcription factor [Trueperella pyogenes]